MRTGRRKSGLQPVDVHVGFRVRLRRKMLGLSQEKLGEALGLTFQQVQKYERGANRISASRLVQLARVLDVPVTFFFDYVDPVRAPAAAVASSSMAADAPQVDPLQSPESIALVNAFYAIADPKIRQILLGLAKALSAPLPGQALTAATAAAPQPAGLSSTRVARRSRPRTRP